MLRRVFLAGNEGYEQINLLANAGNENDLPIKQKGKFSKFLCKTSG
jgi:hypothetical protein